ncbi:histidine kinase [Fulvivirgaceae bacterium PWU4]|uniref:histidine kinase n=1 Tax=Chryseosolibacter histidini TaxID=2782349 RepID=A0AAP2GMB3_9BACT|nr:ATP-binding protein [Chryseosolibacter histidini]MBT1696758.1 histidine kinase [Chryseosolibacter histidini]
MYSSSILEAITGCVHEGVLVLDHSNTIIFASEAAAKFLGTLSAKALTGMHISQVYPEVEQRKLLALLGESNPSAIPLTAEVLQVVHAIRSFNDGSEPVKIITLLDNNGQISKRCQTMAEYTRNLEKSNKELDQFAYIVSHDLKAPLRAISNLSQWLMDDLGTALSGDNLTNLNMLMGRVRRMESLINGILEYSKIGRENTPAEMIDVSALVEEVVEILSPPAHIRVKVSPSMPTLHASKILMFQVFSNLISNAMKFNDKKEGLVTIDSREHDDSYEFTVEDNGPGIPEEYYEKIFVIFQTLQSRDRFESTGIGLTIVKRILTEKGGSIRVESKVGEGSRFVFNWPKEKKQVL